MPEGVQQVEVRRPDPGETAGQILERYQQPGASEGCNWLVDEKGTIYELAGWDRSAPGRGDSFVIVLMPSDDPGQVQAMAWLSGQMARKKGVCWTT
jgi:hypothetical protein